MDLREQEYSVADQQLQLIETMPILLLEGESPLQETLPLEEHGTRIQNFLLNTKTLIFRQIIAENGLKILILTPIITLLTQDIFIPMDLSL